MKKALIVGLSLAMGATLAFGIAACGPTGEPGPTTMTNEEIARAAIQNVVLGHSIAEETERNYKLEGQTKVESDWINVNWSVSSDYESYADYIWVSEQMGSDKQYTVSIPLAEHAKIDYKLTASVTVGEVTKSYDWDKYIPAVGKVYTPSEANALGKTLASNAYYAEGDDAATKIIVQGYVVDAGYWDTSYNNQNKVYIADTPNAEKTDAFYVFRIKPDSTFLKGEGDIKKGDYIAFSGYLQNYSGNTVELTYFDKDNVYVVALERPELSDETIVENAKEALKVDPATFTKEGEYALTSEIDGASISWDVEDGKGLASIAEGKLVIAGELPTEAVEIKLIATIQCNEARATKEFTITVVKLDIGHTGDSIENALNVAEANALAATLAADAHYTENGFVTQLYFKGYVINAGTLSNKGNLTGVYIADRLDAETTDADAIQVYGLELDGKFLKTKNDLVVGSTITIYGFLQNYKGNTHEITYYSGTNPVTVAYEKAEDNRSDEEKVAAALAEIKFPATASEDIALPTSVVEGVTFEFTSNNAAIEVQSDKLHIIRSTEDVTVTISVVGKCGEYTSEAKTFEIVVKANFIMPEDTTTASVVIEDYASANGWANSTAYDKVIIDSNVEVTATGSAVGSYGLNTGKYYTNGQDWRFYQAENAQLTFTAKNGAKILTIKVTYTINNTGILVNADKSVQYESDETIEVGATSVTFTVGNTGTATNGQVRINAITVVYEGGEEHVHNNNGWDFDEESHWKVCTDDKFADPDYTKEAHVWDDENDTECNVCGYTRKVGGDEPTEGFTPITAPVAGTYYFAMDINGTWYYLTGALSGNFAASTTNVSEAATITLEADGDGWLIKANGKYVEIISSTNGTKTYNNIKFNDTRATAINWVWNDEHKIFTWTNENGTLWIGTYNTFTTFSASNISYITNANQYPAKLGTMNGGEEPPQPEINYGTLEAPISVKEALVIAATQCENDRDVTQQVVYMTGVVVGTPTLAEGKTYYQNVTLADVSDSASTILIYTINLREGVVAPQEGDTLVISGYIKNYQGTIEFASNNGTYVYIESNNRENGGEDPVPSVTFVFGEQDVAVANADNMYYWNDQNWCGSNVIVSAATVENGVYTLTYSGATSACWFGAQLFYKNSANVVGETYTVTFKLNASAAGQITVNGQVIDLAVGENAISVTYMESAAASLSIQFGVEAARSVIGDGTFILSDLAFTQGGGEEPPQPETNYGTVEAPISVEAALAIAAEECPNNNDVTAQLVYMIGVVKSVGTIGSYYSNIYVTDQTNGAKTILIYSMNKTEGVVDPAQNDTIVLYGYIKNYNGTLEFASANSQYPVIVSNERGTSTISVLNDGGADVSGLSETALNGTVVSFTVAAKEGKELVSVKVNDTTLTATEGSYSFTMNGNATVTIETKDVGAAVAEVLYTLSTASVMGTNNSYTGNCDMTVDGIVWNLEGNSQINPWRLGGKNLTNQDRKLTSKTAISGKVTKLEISFGAATVTVNSVTLKVYSSDPTVAGATEISSLAVEGYAKNSTATVMADKDWTDCYYQLVFNVSAGSSNQYVTVSTIAFFGFAA